MELDQVLRLESYPKCHKERPLATLSTHSNDQEKNPARKTALYETHLKYGAKIVPFGGWNMPVSYGSVLNEHHAVRNGCGLFDVSHMGEIVVSGPSSLNFLQRLTINDLSKLRIGEGQYSAMLHESGGMIDDIIVYRLAAETYFICVNASNIEKDFQWLFQNAKDRSGVRVEDQSNSWGQLAIQGPHSLLALSSIFDDKQLKSLQYMQIMETSFRGLRCLIARTGYTGERGYEVYSPPSTLPPMWESLMETADKTGIKPIGLGARDTLRLEACYLLYGNDMNDEVSPLEAGIGWACKLEKGDFIGATALRSQKTEGLKRKLFAFKMIDDGIPRHDMRAYSNSKASLVSAETCTSQDFTSDLKNISLGWITSGSVLPSVGGAGGMALLDPHQVKIGDRFFVDIRGKLKAAVITERPLYKAKVKED